jgi:basic membrane lipoprotein Med (substrate-binding protein (PBP1-ABC) superfamily)
MEDLILNQGTEVIFTTTPQLISASLKVAVQYPDVKILNCSLNTSHKYIRTYYARLYEAKFLSGMIAGCLTESNKIGYMADYPIVGTIANINAFALGAKLVNPEVKVYLWWTTLDVNYTKEEIYREYYDEHIDYISDQDFITPKHASRRYGVYKLTDGAPVNIGFPYYNWGVLYEKIIRIIINGAWKQTETESSKAINYWWGLSAGVIDTILSGKLPYETQRLVNMFKQMIIDDQLAPFEGEIRSQDGTVMNKDGERMQSEDIMNMDWLVDNVIGNIPVINDLEEGARSIVELKGVKKNEDENTGTRG